MSRCVELGSWQRGGARQVPHGGAGIGGVEIRHTFASMLEEQGVPSDDRDRLMGHGPKDVKARNYDVVRLPELYAEICKLPSLLDASEKLGDQEGSGLEDGRLVTTLVTEPGDQTGPDHETAEILAEEEGNTFASRLRLRRNVAAPEPIRSAPDCVRLRG